MTRQGRAREWHRTRDGLAGMQWVGQPIAQAETYQINTCHSLLWSVKSVLAPNMSLMSTATQCLLACGVCVKAVIGPVLVWGDMCDNTLAVV